MNLDVASGFSAVAPVVASDPVGPLTGIHYPSSLIWPDRRGFEPRVGLSWRPIPASTVVVRGGYGIYDDTSVYQTSALQLAQQSPLSTSLSVQNSPNCQLTLANGFVPCQSITTNTFAVDPNFRVGYAQTWQLSVQRDLPGALQLTATYLGVKGTRGVQQFLPNTYPIGADQSMYRLSSRVLSIRLRAATPRGNRARSNCAAGCAAASPRHCSIPIRSRSMMTHTWAARVMWSPAARLRRPREGKARDKDLAKARREPRPPPRKAHRRQRPSRRTGSTCMPSVPFPPSINVTCSTCRPNTPPAKASAVEH